MILVCGLALGLGLGFGLNTSSSASLVSADELKICQDAVSTLTTAGYLNASNLPETKYTLDEEFCNVATRKRFGSQLA